MSAKTRLLAKYPQAKVVSERYKVDQANFDRQKQKLASKKSEGGAVGLIWLNSEILVLSKRTGLHPGWALLGGTVESNEDFDTAFIREAKEESGLDIMIQRLFMLEQKLFIAPDGEELEMDLAVFEAIAKGRQALQQTKEALEEDVEVQAFTMDELPSEMILKDAEKLEEMLVSH